LVIKVDRRVRLRVGSLGDIAFPPGVYVYTGSATRGLLARVGRHLRKQKRKHWHIDYLLASRHARVVGVILVTDARISECEINRWVLSLAESTVSAFGSSDCQKGCGSHLAYFAPSACVRGHPVRDTSWKDHHESQA